MCNPENEKEKTPYISSPNYQRETWQVVVCYGYMSILIVWEKYQFRESSSLLKLWYF